MSPVIRDSESAGRRRWLTAAYVVLVLVLTSLVARYVVRNFDGPMIHRLDPGVYAFTSYYFSRNISFFPLPHLDLETTWTVYPYGITHVFLHWTFERDVFYTLLASRFGTGPWFQCYFVLSVLITALGAYLILRNTCGPKRAAAVGIAVSFFNFYAIRKFPSHLPYACTHWTVLGILLDYVLMWRYWHRQEISPRLLLARLALLFLCLGLDPGYVAGYCLTSFCLTAGWITTIALFRHRGDLRSLRRAAVGATRRAIERARSHRAQVGGLAAVGLLAGWLYVPLAYQVAQAASQFDFSGLANYTQSETPLRLFIPFFPGFNPDTTRELFADRGEYSGFHFSPGISFVILGLLGLAIGYRRFAVAVPFLLLFLLCLLFDPDSFPVLKILPWFRFSRIPGRATCVFPVILAVLALNLPRLDWRSWWVRVAAFLMAALLLTESVVAYGLIVGLRARTREFVPDQRFLNAMAEIRSTPGEALFEWPFSIAPRSEGLGYYHVQLGGLFQLAQFHHKKVMGTYFGRLHPDSLTTLVDRGWPHLLFPDSLGNERRRQRRDFVEEEWDFIEKFYFLNDFAGILLYVDLLPEATVAGFHQRFGEPTAQFVVLPGPRRIQFIAKKPEWRKLVDREKGAAVRLQRPVFTLPVNERLPLTELRSDDYLFAGWANPQKEFRWTHGARATVVFRLATSGDLMLRMSAATYGDQHVAVSMNGTPLAQLAMSGGAPAEVGTTVPSDALREINVLVFEFPEAVEREGAWGPRLVGMRVEWIELARAE